ncbi:MAG: outer membrane beta-barrel protein [Flavisolibacter sp.]|nr:outer membrane beta-barrel protein [Flavisolibacter sp.]
MKKILCLAFILSVSVTSFAQFRLGVFGGLSNYQGDLVDKPFQSSRAAVGITGTFTLSQRFNIRTGITFGRVAAADSLSNSEVLRSRNLSFQSNIAEFSVLAEYNIFNIEQVRWTPYVFAGLALYHFDPFTYGQDGIQTYLQPLTTEGQGIEGYGSKPYNLTQIAIPFGGGIKYAISDRVHLGLELGLRKLFTDHLDDVSGNYADPGELVAARGPRSAELAYRGDEVAGGELLAPDKGAMRGSPKYKDYYYFTGLHLSFQLGNGGGDKGYGCPKVTF